MRRTTALAALAGIALLAPGAEAAPKPQLTDPKGDGPVAGADIVSATLSTKKVRGRDHLQIEVAYAGAIVGSPPHTRGITFTVGGCRFSATHYGHGTGAVAAHDVGCATGDSRGAHGSMQINGSVLTFRVPLDGKDLRIGARVSGLDAFTHPGGVVALHTPLTTAGDTATGRDWVISRPSR